MKLNNDAIAEWPSVLRNRTPRLKERHSILNYLNLAEYDRTKPGYISLQQLVSGNTDVFCENVLKIPTQQYYDFVKTL